MTASQPRAIGIVLSGAILLALPATASAAEKGGFLSSMANRVSNRTSQDQLSKAALEARTKVNTSGGDWTAKGKPVTANTGALRLGGFAVHVGRTVKATRSQGDGYAGVEHVTNRTVGITRGATMDGTTGQVKAKFALMHTSGEHAWSGGRGGFRPVVRWNEKQRGSKPRDVAAR